MQGNGRMQKLPGQATEGSASLASSAESAVPQSWVAMRSDEGEAMHRLRHDEGTPVSLAGELRALCGCTHSLPKAAASMAVSSAHEAPLAIVLFSSAHVGQARG
jgi:hypothetical protein